MATVDPFFASPLAALLVSPAFAERAAVIEQLGTDLDGDARFEPFVKALRSGLRRGVERKAVRG
jgi:hypothetical protein